jgi:predicted Zn-dependent peptidase
MIKPIVKKYFDTPFPVYIHKLDNGLTLYLSPNNLEPRIQSSIVVKAGSKHDPEDCTGLAHYFEHMMFKGSSKIGTINWEKERVLLEQIETLYEKHRATDSIEERAEIYAEIDRISNEAANYAVPNEYDKIISEIGGKDTNAYTWVEQTVYLNNIPSNQLTNWLRLEAERFRHVSLRLFHTELETVFEEFNITQDSDPRKVSKAINEILFPTHPYGTHTTIGRGEDLKAPSQTAIHKFFKQYYVPNNMAICLAGDFDVEEAISAIEKNWGDFEAGEVPPFNFEEQAILKENQEKTVYGQKSDYIEVAWRLPGANAANLPYFDFIQSILQNAQVGLVDWVKRSQKVLDANAYIYTFKDYASLRINAQPRQGQSLDEVKEIIFEIVEKLKSGSYEEWIIPGIIKDIKLSIVNNADSNNSRASVMSQYAIWDVEWDFFAKRLETLENITKADITNFIQENLSEGAAVIYKKQGDDPEVLKMEKPHITPLPMNKEEQSEFAEDILSYQVKDIHSKFLDLGAHITETKLSNDNILHYQKNNFNEAFKSTIHWNIGKFNKKEIGLINALINYIFTKDYSLENFQNTLFQNGLFIQSKTSGENALVSIQGLGESFEKGIELLQAIISGATISEEALKNIKIDLFKSRINALSNKQLILREGLLNYVKYGADNPFTLRMSPQEILDFSTEDANALIRDLLSYPFKFYYYGDLEHDKAETIINTHFGRKAAENSIPPHINFKIQDCKNTSVYVLDFPMVQTDILFHTKCSDEFNLEDFIMAEWYNQYFGYGLSSIMFQEIREAKAYGYSTYAYFSSPSKKEKEHNLTAYLGTQPDKVNTAIPDIMELLDDMPYVPNQVEQAKLSILKNLESSRINRQNIYWTWLKNNKLGLEEDMRALIYDRLKEASHDDLKAFHKRVIKNKNFNIILMGPVDQLDMEYISSFGEVTQLKKEEVLGYTEDEILKALNKL